MPTQKNMTSEISQSALKNYKDNCNHFSKEMIAKLQVLLPFSPIELVNSINDYWGSSREKTQEAQEIYSTRSTNTPI